MNNLNRVLVIDDKFEEFKEKLEQDFTSKGIEIFFCQNKDEGIKQLNSHKHFDLVILDWYLDGEGSELSLLFLSELKKCCFIPVFVWTHQYYNYEQDFSNGKILYPKDLIDGISKEDIDSAKLKEKVLELYSICKIAHLSEIYRETIHRKLEEVFFELSEISSINLVKMIKSISGKNNNIDWSNDLILNFIHRKLISDADFIKGINDLLSSADKTEIQEENIQKEIINKIMYFKPTPNRLRCGDIIKIKDSEGASKIGIIVNPDCDLSNNKTRYIELIELRELDDSEMSLTTENKKNIKKFNHSSFYFFPAIQSEKKYLDFVAIYKSKFVLSERSDENNSSYPMSSKLLDYNDYFSIGNTLAEIEFICCLDEPYKSDFLNHLHSHNLRVGIPDIKNLWLS